MARIRVAGVAVMAPGVIGYGAGTLAAYPGWALSVTATMVDITPWAIGGDVR